MRILAIVLCLAAHTTQTNVTATLSALNNSDWTKRSAAVDELERMLERDASLGSNEDVRTAVAALLDRETDYIRQMVASGGPGFGYSEYYFGTLAELAVKLAQIGPTAHSGLLGALVRSVHNPDSRLTTILAEHGEPVAPHLFALTANPDAGERINAYALAAELLSADRARRLRHPLSAQTRSQVISALRAGLQDAEPVGRREAIKGVVVARDRDSIPILQHLAATDPALSGDVKPRFAVREEAALALKRLQSLPR